MILSEAHNFFSRFVTSMEYTPVNWFTGVCLKWLSGKYFSFPIVIEDISINFKNMKSLSCKDMGMSDDFVAKGETKEEVMGKMMEHAKMEHKDMMDKMSDAEKEEMKKKMEGNMKDEM